MSKHAKLHAPDISCAHCAMTIKRELAPLEGVATVVVDVPSKTIALDYAADGIRCNCICPGITDTPLLRMHLASTPDPEATLSRRLRRVPMGIACTPTDIAKAALYLSCEDSSGITGTSLVVDCGYLTAAEWENRDA